MEEKKNLETLSENVSDKILESIYLIEILDELYDGCGKEGILLTSLKRNMKSAFEAIEDCRKMISCPN